MVQRWIISKTKRYGRDCSRAVNNCSDFGGFVSSTEERVRSNVESYLIFFTSRAHFAASRNAVIPFSTTTISNPQKYDQFKLRKIATDHDYVYIEAGAHPNILGEAKHFWNASNHIIDFRDVDYKFNYITLQPNEQKVVAVFQDGYNMTTGLPANYVDYSVAFSLNAFVTAADIEAILQWHNAKYLEIHDECDVAYMLLTRIDDMQKMQHLKTIKLDIQKNSIDKMKLKAFLGNFPELKRAEFKFRRFSDEEIEDFLTGQDIPEHFKLVDSPSGSAAFAAKS